MSELATRAAIEASVATTPPAATPRAHTWRRLLRDPLAWVGGTVLLLLVLIASVPGAFTALSPASHETGPCEIRQSDGSFRDRLGPSSDHWFGTDLEGCDVYNRVIRATRPSLAVGVVALAVSSGVAVGLVLVSLFTGSTGDAIVSGATDVWFGIPGVVGAILILSLVDGSRGIVLVGCVIGVLSWPLPMRILRSSARRTIQRGFVEQLRAAGATRWRIVVRHVVPNSMGPFIVYSAVSFGVLIVAEAMLTFLGVGLSGADTSWGGLIATAEGRFTTDPHLVLAPGAFLSVTVLAVVLLADALRDALDPRGAGRG